MGFSSKSQSTHTFSIGPDKHGSLRNNNVARSPDNLSDNTQFNHLSHQEILLKQRFDHAPYQYTYRYFSIHDLHISNKNFVHFFPLQLKFDL